LPANEAGTITSRPRIGLTDMPVNMNSAENAAAIMNSP
jgi:hypothetical protein